MSHPIFVVSTGRCGSTLISNILNESGKILSLSEFFVSLSPLAFSKQELNGDEFWEILATPRPKVMQMLRNNIGIPEFLYPSNDGVPPILLMTLPHITKAPEQLFKEVKEFTTNLPINKLENQYTNLFEWLREKFNKQIWVERSGGSLRFIPQLQKLFPNARFIHLYRDGRECAMSMSRHHSFRLTMIQQMIKEITGLDPYVEETPIEQIRELGKLANLLPNRFDVEAYHQYELPIERFGRLWASQIITGLSHLKQVPKENLLHLRYEDILKSPVEQINRLMRFMMPDFKDDCFVDRMASTVQTNKIDTWVKLDEKTRHNLTKECAVGLRLLNYN